MSGEDAQTIATTWPGADRLNKVWRDALDTLIREKQAEAWDAAVAAMVYEDGTPVQAVKNINPYRSQKTEPNPTAEETPE